MTYIYIYIYIYYIFCNKIFSPLQRPETYHANLNMPPSHYQDYDGTFTVPFVFLNHNSIKFWLSTLAHLHSQPIHFVAFLKDILLRAITKEHNSSGVCQQLAVKIHQHKICTIYKVRTIASNITAKQTEYPIMHRHHQHTDWNYSCVWAV